jgi:hypothetical protein
MTPALQRGLTFLIVLTAVVYLAWRSWQQARKAAALRRATGCGPGCGCE